MPDIFPAAVRRCASHINFAPTYNLCGAIIQSKAHAEILLQKFLPARNIFFTDNLKLSSWLQKSRKSSAFSM